MTTSTVNDIAQSVKMDASENSAIAERFLVYDDLLLQQDFVTRDKQNLSTVVLSIDGITCAACSWKIESTLTELACIETVNMNYSSHTADVTWHSDSLKLSTILARIDSLGFTAWPFHHKRQDSQQKQEKRARLLRIACAVLFGMQVMMLSIGLYFSAWGMDPAMQQFLQWVAMLLTLPVLLYSGQTFFVNAWRDLKNHRLSMDVPVASGLLLAFLGSVEATISAKGEVYFDSICMLILFLLVSRYGEFQTRLNANKHVEKLYRVRPETANKIIDPASHQLETIAAIKLRPGEWILVRAGENIPIDGEVLEGESAVNESLLTGEASPVPKMKGAHVIAGSTNMQSPLIVKVTAVGQHTRLQQILQLTQRGRLEKPKFTAFVNRFASWFILAVIIIASMTAIYWYLHDPEHWLAITVSVLVVTCPCALSLATPTAYSAANNSMLSAGIAVAGQNVLQILAAADTFIFDKTGTLTTGELALVAVDCFTSMTARECHMIAASVEYRSEHQIAKAIVEPVNPDELLRAENTLNYPGEGMSAMIDGQRYYLGSADFIFKQTNCRARQTESLHERLITEVFLANSSAVLCVFMLQDHERVGAKDLIHYLQGQGRHTVLLSGDKQNVVTAIADKLNIEHALGERLPEQKLDYLQKKLAAEEVLVMIGDGINDAPSLAAAHISIAMGSGADVSKLNADMILLNNDIQQLAYVHALAYRFMGILKQNIGWAISYNVLALPLAVSGLLPPWLAALGMSLSSLIVVVNSTRLGPPTKVTA